MASFIDRLLSRVGLARASTVGTTTTRYAVTPESNPRDYFALMDNYYQGNAVYDLGTRTARGMNANLVGIQALRNPAFRVTEFYVATVWPGTLPEALPIEADNEALLEPIGEVWKWSNWNAQKQPAIRQLAKFGNMFIKVAQRDDGRPFLQLLDTLYVTELEEDSRGIVQRFRMDVPKVRDPYTAQAKSYTYTEVWDLDGVRVYEHDKGDDDESRLGTPADKSTLQELQLDFVPLVHAKLRDVGSRWGHGAFAHAIDKIDEANRKSTRQSAMLYRHNKALWGLMGGHSDASGRPLAPPRITNADGTPAADDFMATLNDDSIINLPGSSKLESLIPNINYTAALAFLQDDMLELEADMPELAYARISMASASSGIELRIRLTPAIANAKEARGNAEAALVRANQIALTIGMNAGVFENVGDYESGTLEHTFKARDVIPLSEDDKAGVQLKEAQSNQADVAAGMPLITALRRRGWAEAEIVEFERDMKAKATADKQQLAAAVLNAQREFDRGAQEVTA